MGSGFSKMKKQAKAMQAQYAKMQEEAQALRLTGTAGNGLVSIVMNGEKAVQSIDIKPECVDPDDIEGLQDLLIAAFTDAAKQADDKNPENDMMGGLPF
ncbi:MAG: YbaB/EbfC family nucleoid-associated protein [Simkaniaceae bacterium]|nr:YbaB/EbfC family nucleoid-associated protein [Simkaniaceae bacterium]